MSFSSWPRPVASSSSDAASSALSWGRGQSSSLIAHPRSGSAVNCLTAASTVVVVVKPGGFEMRALSRLDEVIGELRETGIRPDLSISGVILTEVQARRTINDQVEEELKKLYPVFGRIRSEAKLVYATTEGRITELTRSNAFDDYQRVTEQLGEFIPWLRS